MLKTMLHARLPPRESISPESGRGPFRPRSQQWCGHARRFGVLDLALVFQVRGLI